jgi:hypothetical protein
MELEKPRRQVNRITARSGLILQRGSDREVLLQDLGRGWCVDWSEDLRNPPPEEGDVEVGGICLVGVCFTFGGGCWSWLGSVRCSNADFFYLTGLIQELEVGSWR